TARQFAPHRRERPRIEKNVGGWQDYWSGAEDSGSFFVRKLAHQISKRGRAGVLLETIEQFQSPSAVHIEFVFVVEFRGIDDIDSRIAVAEAVHAPKSLGNAIKWCQVTDQMIAAKICSNLAS